LNSLLTTRDQSHVLGLSFDYHNAAATIIRDGEVVAAAQEERFSRQKNDPRFPGSAIDFCLAEAGIVPSDLSHVVFYERPLLKFDRILKTAIKFPRIDLRLVDRVLSLWFAEGKFSPRERIADYLGIEKSKVELMSHHLSHAASAFYTSPFKTAAVVTLDGVGEHETGTIWHGIDNRLEKISASHYPNSLGLFYSAITAYLGFEVNEGEYKVMGMAPYGSPEYLDKFRSLFSVDRKGRLSLAQQYFNFTNPADLPFNKRLTDLLGEPRKPESPFNPGQYLSQGEQDDGETQSRHYANVAASAQKCTEEIVFEIVERALKLTSERCLCLAGGVALNSVANGRLQRELNCELYVQPEAGDAGGSMGAAMAKYYQGHTAQDRKALISPYQGSDINDTEIEAAIRTGATGPFRKSPTEEDMVSEVAKALYEGNAIGWMQGRAEWGPRSLGNRSILADPRGADVRDRVNEKIKFRELFRPFAPSVTAEAACEFFDVEENLPNTSPEHFMLSVCRVHNEKRDVLQAVTHVDGSARVHIVDREVNPLFHDLISEFGQLSGVPVLLNTSFNRRGEPIVNSPADALKTFSMSGLDLLIMGNFIVEQGADPFEL